MIPCHRFAAVAITLGLLIACHARADDCIGPGFEAQAAGRYAEAVERYRQALSLPACRSAETRAIMHFNVGLLQLDRLEQPCAATTALTSSVELTGDADVKAAAQRRLSDARAACDGQRAAVDEPPEPEPEPAPTRPEPAPVTEQTTAEPEPTPDPSPSTTWRLGLRAEGGAADVTVERADDIATTPGAALGASIWGEWAARRWIALRLETGAAWRVIAFEARDPWPQTGVWREWSAHAAALTRLQLPLSLDLVFGVAGTLLGDLDEAPTAFGDSSRAVDQHAADIRATSLLGLGAAPAIFPAGLRVEVRYARDITGWFSADGQLGTHRLVLAVESHLSF